MQPIVHLRLLGALLFLSVAAPASKNFVTLVSSPVIAQYGQPAILPCWLDPPQSAAGLEIRWYQDENYDNPIILYHNRKLTSSVEGVPDRVTFGVKDSNSKGLDAGDVSLRFSNVTIKDEGNYTCYVSSDQGYDRGSVSLRVRKTGSQPKISVMWVGENQVNVSCESAGWYPQPRLHWWDHAVELAPESLLHRSSSSGSVLVNSWLMVSGSSGVSCSVGVSEENVKKAIIHLQGTQPVCEGSDSSIVGWLALGVALGLLLGLAILAVYLRKRVCRTKNKKDKKDEESELGRTKNEKDEESKEKEKLLQEKEKPDEFQPFYENITLEATDNDFITVKNDVSVRDNIDYQLPDGEEVNFRTAIKGKPGFSKGKHCWDVSLQRPNVELKRSWWVGLTNAKNLNEFYEEGSTASGDYWFLASDSVDQDSLQLRTKSQHVCFPCERPQTVRVYLDIESGELSFFDIERNTKIVSMKAKFTNELFPLFNPGKGDDSPMVILHKVK